jgi:hypothetical protein
MRQAFKVDKQLKEAAKEAAESLSWQERLDWDNLSLEEKVEILASELLEN